MSSGASNPSSSNKRTSQAAAVSSRGPSSAAATGRSRSGIAPPAVATAISATASSNSPEDYWRNGVLAEVSPQQIGFLAEGLFKELWSRCGKDIAVNQISLMVAEVQFARGFDLLYKIHDNEAALVEFKKCLKIREHILGNDHRDTGKTYCFVGHTLREKRDYDNSLGQYRSALRILVALLGKNHNHTKDVISCVDDVLKAKELPDEEVSDYLTCLLTSMEHKRKGDELMETDGGDYDLAIEEYKRALVVEEISGIASLGKYHPDTGAIYSKIGTCLARIGDLKGAAVEYGQALSIYAVTLGSDHKDTKEALQNIQNLPSLMMR